MRVHPPLEHVSHPIVRLEVLGPDGHRQTALRVFCRERRTAVPVGVCAACRQCEGIVESPAPAVTCLVTEARATLPYDPLGLRTPVAEVLTSETVAVEAETTLGEAIAHLRSEGRWPPLASRGAPSLNASERKREAERRLHRPSGCDPLMPLCSPS